MAIAVNSIFQSTGTFIAVPNYFDELQLIQAKNIAAIVTTGHYPSLPVDVPFTNDIHHISFDIPIQRADYALQQLSSTDEENKYVHEFADGITTELLGISIDLGPYELHFPDIQIMNREEIEQKIAENKDDVVRFNCTFDIAKSYTKFTRWTGDNTGKSN